jgi:transcriptional regulator with XRE-family HTH domain
MVIRGNLSDEAVLREIGQRLAQLRLSKNIQQADLAKQAGIGEATLQRLERGVPVGLTSLIRVLRALGRLEALDAGIPAPLPSPLDQLRLGRRYRQRSRQPVGHGRSDEPSGWRWGDEGAVQA